MVEECQRALEEIHMPSLEVASICDVILSSLEKIVNLLVSVDLLDYWITSLNHIFGLASLNESVILFFYGLVHGLNAITSIRKMENFKFFASFV